MTREQLLMLAGVALAVGVPLLWLIGTYNGLVRLGLHVKESWSGIDTELKRRYDLIPNLVEAVKGCAAHEREVFERVARARAAAMSEHGSLREQARDENAMIGSLRGVLALAEGYPQLRSDANFLHLQRELVNTEDRIQASRRFYNANVRDLNARCASFPSNLVASVAGIRPAEFYEIEDAGVRAVPAVGLA